MLRALPVVIAAFVVPFAAAEAPRAQQPVVIAKKPYVPKEPAWVGELIVFVGKKLGVDETGMTDFDEVFRARYQVLDVVHGKFDGDVIAFDACVSVPMQQRNSREAPSLRKLYPPGDFSRSGNRVRCKRGAYAEELFEIARRHVLPGLGYKG